MANTQIASDHKNRFTAIHEQNMCFCLALHFNQPELRLYISKLVSDQDVPFFFPNSFIYVHVFFIPYNNQL